MTIARATRTLLAFIAATVIVWSFFDVANRVRLRWKLQHERPITLRILHWGNTSEVEIMKTLVATYEQQHPNVRVIRIHTPSGSGELKNKLRTMLAAGDPPALF